jgi:hypothetical protein
MSDKYQNLLAALAQFIKVNRDQDKLDHFLTGFAGDDWKRATAGSGPGRIVDHRQDKDGRIFYLVNKQWLDYEELIWLLADAMPPGTVPDYEIDSEAEAQAIKLIEAYFDRREWEVVGYKRPIHF